jgi:hypothetical protein
MAVRIGRGAAGAAALLLLLLCAAPAPAQSPETVEGLGPANGDWELEYVGQFGDPDGSDAPRQHSGQSFYGVTDGFAIGGETLLSYRSGPLVEEDRIYFDYDSVVGIFRFSDAERDPVGAGLWLQAGLDADGELARLEARLIIEKKSPSWWLQANAMLRRVNEEAEEGAHLAYAGRARFAALPDLWLGLEASGQAVRISGFEREPFRESHYAGPTAAYELALSRKVEAMLGLAYLRRIDSDRGFSDVIQLSGSFRF